MADNVEFQADNLATPSPSTIVATDQIGTAHYQLMKFALGGDGSASFLSIGQQTSASSLPVVIASNQTAIPVSGSVSASGTFPVTQSGTWNIGTLTTLTAGSVSINNPSGASAVNIQDGGNSITIDGAVTVSGSVSASGTFPVTQSGTWNIDTVSTLTAGSVSINNPSGASAVNIQDGGNSITVDGTISACEARSTTVTTASVNAVTTSTTLIASNANRLGATVHNDSPAQLMLKLGATAASTSFTVRMAASSYYEVPFNYTGIIDGIWTGASGAALLGEFTA